MKSIWDMLTNMNGWKAVIAIVSTAGASYLGLHDDIKDAQNNLKTFIEVQSVRNATLDHQLEIYRMEQREDMFKLQESVRGIKSGRTK